MRELKILPLLLYIVLSACSSEHNAAKKNKSLAKFEQVSKSVGDTFYIDVQLPEAYFDNPKKKYPTLVLIDGNFYFPMMAAVASQYEIAGLLEPSILVGVGYKSFKYMDSVRVRDYLYPKSLPSDEMEADGGGKNFHQYLTEELLPKIDSQYRTDINKRALLGDSFGGYFVLYSLLNQLQNNTNHFQNFISASPTLWYNNFYLNQLPEELAQSKKQLGIFLSVGDLEDSAWSVKPVRDLAAAMQKYNIEGVEFKTQIYNHLDHMDVAVLSFTKGLQELSNDK